VDVITKGHGHLGRVGRGWPVRPVDTVDGLPQWAQVTLRMVVGQLHDHPSSGVAVEGDQKKGRGPLQGCYKPMIGI
jgi:hypothetical protein